jgi:hypothetical protein
MRVRTSPGRPRFRPSPATVLSVVALFVALGGSAYAATAISGSQIRLHSIPANRLKNHSITGAQVNLNELGTVPRAVSATRSGTAKTASSATTAGSAVDAINATNATNAANASVAQNSDAVDGSTITPLVFDEPPGGTSVTGFNADDLVVSASCNAHGQVVLTATSTATGADLFGHVIDGAGAVKAIADNAFGGNTAGVDLTAGFATADANPKASATVEYFAAPGPVVTINYGFDDSPTENNGTGCAVFGTAIASAASSHG